MKIINKLLVLCLTVMMLFSAVPSVAFAEEISDSDVYGKDALGIINALGISVFSEDELGDIITRADFLTIMAKTAGYTGVSNPTKVFADLSTEDEREPYLKALYTAGIIAPNKNGNIMPEGKIALAEAVSVAVRIAGYGPMADAKGGYSVGYFTVAVQNDFLEELPQVHNMVLTKGMAIKLALNTLEAPCMIQTNIGSEKTPEYKKDTEVNLLNTNHGVYKLEGVLNGVDLSRVSGKDDVKAYHIEVDGFPIYVRGIGRFYNMLGYGVNAYYREEKNGVNRLVYIEKTSELNEEMIVDVGDIESYKNGKINVYEGNKTKAYSLKSTVPVIYNGVATKQAFSEKLYKDKNGKLRIIDNTGDGKFDVVCMDLYDNYVVSHIDTTNFVIYNLYDNTDKIKLDVTIDDPYTTIYDASGEEIKIGKLKAGQVISVYVSASDAYQGYINAYVCSGTIEGVIESIEDNDKFVINGVEYQPTKECLKNRSNVFVVGESIVATLDIGGKIAYVEKAEETAYQYGFIAAAGTESGIDSILKLKLRTMSNEFMLYSVADKITLDGKRYESTDSKVLKRLNLACKAQFEGAADDAYNSMVRYKLNSDSEITAIDTIINEGTGELAKREDYHTANDTLFTLSTDISASNSKNYHRRTNRAIGHQIGYNEGALLMYHPSPVSEDYSNMHDDDLYVVGDVYSMLSHSSPYAVVAYYDNPDELKTNMISLTYASSSYSSVNIEDAGTYIISGISEVYDEMTEGTAKCFTVQGRYDERKIVVKDDLVIKGKADTGDDSIKEEMKVSDLKIGDVIAYRADHFGYVKYIQLIFRTESSTEVNFTGITKARWNGASMRYGALYDKYENGWLVYYVSSNAELKNLDMSTITAEDCEIVTDIKDSTACFEYTDGIGGNKVVKVSSPSQVKSYKETGDDCSKFIMQQAYGTIFLCLSY